ncbi:MAG: hypothetical protein AB8B50_19605 [Pirellulaceae bacterium]
MNDRPVRIAMVVNGYFPIVTDSTLRLMLVAQRLHEAGAIVDVITKHWFRRWPKKVRTGAATIYRVDAPSRLGLHGSGFARQARQRILDNQVYYSAIFFDRFDDTTAHFGRYRPKNCGQLVFRLCASDVATNVSKPDKVQAVFERARETASRFDQVLVPEKSTWDRVIADKAWSEGNVRDGLKRVEDCEAVHGSELAVSRSIGDRRISRQALGATCQELILAPTDRVVVCFCDLESDVESLKLLEAIGSLTENRSRLRLWFAGLSACGKEMASLVEQRNWQYSVTSVGTFSDASSLLQIADLVVIPGQRQGGSCIQSICVQQKIPFLSLTAELGGASQQHPSSALYPPSLQELKGTLRKWYDDVEHLQHDLMRAHNEWSMREEPISGSIQRPLSVAAAMAQSVLQEARVIDA